MRAVRKAGDFVMNDLAFLMLFCFGSQDGQAKRFGWNNFVVSDAATGIHDGSRLEISIVEA